MRIRNQVWLRHSRYLIITLREPFWSASQKFNWPFVSEGFGISKEAFDYAKELGLSIKIKTLRYGQYTITPNKIEPYLDCKFTSRDKKTLIVIPRMACTKIDEDKLRADYEKKEMVRRKINDQLDLI